MRTRRLPILLLLAGATGLVAACGGGGGPDAGDTGGNDATDMVVPPDNPPPEDVPVDNPPPVDVPVDNPVDTPPDTPMPTARTLPTNGSAVVVSADDRVVVAVNRTAGSVTVFRDANLAASPPALGTRTVISTGANSEPWAAVISQDGNTAWVILRHDRQLVRIENLRGTPTLGAMRGQTDSEPTGIAISPSGARIYVANWAEGTVTEHNAADASQVRRIDLNGPLARSGMLGNSIDQVLGATGTRPGIAHPRAIVVTNNGDTNDADETVYVTEFFSQARTSGVPTDGQSEFDVARQGVVYRFNAGTGAVGGLITIAPVANTGFQSSDNMNTGCFPNQLYAAAIRSGRLYVTSVCASPRGPTGPVTAGTPPMTDVRNFKTEVHAAVFVVDTASNAEIPAQGLILTKRFEDFYVGANPAMPRVPDDGTRRVPLIPNDIAFVPGSSIAYLSAYGSDAVFRVAYNADGTLNAVGSPVRDFINLRPGGAIPNGFLPVGVAVVNTIGAQRAVAINENSRNLSVIDLTMQAVAVAQPTADAPTGTAAEVNVGRRFFVTGLGRWSLRGQSWNSCEACHPDGLTDNVTWFFARGPRQTTSLDGTFSPDGMTQRILNWTAIFDEVHDFELNTRGNSGGVGAIVHRVGMPVSADDRIIFDGTAPTGAQVATASPQAGLSGSVRDIQNSGVPALPMGTVRVDPTIRDWNEIDAYHRTIRSPRRSVQVETVMAMSDDARMGRMIFQTNNCGGCHAGPSWTISRLFYTPGQTVNAPAPTAMGSLRTTRYTLPGGYPAALNPPANNLMRSAALRFDDIATAAANDQINCVLRDVGTFPAMLGAGEPGVAPMGVRVREVRTNMMTAAQGATGFNPPSLFGMITGAPFFHAGNARTLEELFSNTFARHHQAHSPNFLDPSTDVMIRNTQIRQLIAFLLTIDDMQMAESRPTGTPDLCPVRFP